MCATMKSPYTNATPPPNANCAPGLDGVVPGSVTM